MDHRWAILALLGVGIIRLASVAIQFAKAIWIMFLRPSRDLKSYGSWALVTGASDGIGKAFCYELAKKGINLVLIGRSEEKLQELTKHLAKSHGINARFVVVDFADAENLESGLSKISQEIEELDIGILINNVGVSYPYARFFHEVDRSLLEELIQVNIRATSLMCHTVIPSMIKRHKGAIINVGSGSGSILPADPLYSAYAASKGYVEAFSRSLHVEYKQSGIDVQCQVPLYVKTKLAKIRNTSLTVPSPELYAKWALKSVGYERVATPYWAHHILWWIISVIPECIIDGIRLKTNIDIRRRGLLKDTKIIKNN